MGEIDGRPKTVRTSFTKPSRNCHDETSQNIRKKMLILPQKYYICDTNKNLHNCENSKIGTYRHSNGIRGGSLHFLQSFG